MKLGKYKLIEDEMVFFDGKSILLSAGVEIEAIRLSDPDDEPGWAVMKYDCVEPGAVCWRGPSWENNLERIPGENYHD